MINPLKISDVLSQASQMQEEVQRKLGETVVEASSGGGAVTATMNGKKQLLKLRIDPSAVVGLSGGQPDVEMLEDLVVAAINEAGRKADEAIQSSMQGMLGGLKIPGPHLAAKRPASRHPEHRSAQPCGVQSVGDSAQSRRASTRMGARPTSSNHYRHLEEAHPVSRYAEPMARLIEELKKLPGVGTKSAQRFAFHILRSTDDDAAALAEAVRGLKASLRLCSICNNVTDVDPCAYCASPTRNQRLVCVVEEPTSIDAVERTRGYQRRLPRSPRHALAPPRRRPRSVARRHPRRPRRARRNRRGHPRHQPHPRRRSHRQLARRRPARLPGPHHPHRHRRPRRQRHRIRRRSHHDPRPRRPSRTLNCLRLLRNALVS